MPKYLYAFDLSIDSPGFVIFDLDTYESVLITSFQPKKSLSHGMKLHHIKSEIIRVGQPYPPHEVALERGFSRFNTATQVIFRVVGIINELLRNYPQTYYTPKSVKAAIVGGEATKKMVQDAIRVKCPHITFANEDESDAFAVGITHMIAKHGMVWEKPEKIAKPRKPRQPRKKKSDVLDKT